MTTANEVLDNLGGAFLIGSCLVLRPLLWPLLCPRDARWGASDLDYAPHTLGQKVMWEWSTDPIGFVMTRRMRLGIKARAERQ